MKSLTNLLKLIGYLVMFIALFVTGTGMLTGLIWSFGILTLENFIGVAIVAFVMASAITKGCVNWD